MQWYQPTEKNSKGIINRVSIDKAMYLRDSTAIVANLYQKMKNHEGSFTNPEYFDSTVLIIDTIIYDLSLNKISTFVIAKNPTTETLIQILNYHIIIMLIAIWEKE